MSLLAGSKTPISPVFILQLSEACPQPFLYATIRPSYGRTPTPLPPEWKATLEATVHHLHPAHAVASAAVDRAMERQDQQNDWRKGDGLLAARLWPHLKHEKICDLTRRSPLWPCKIAAELLRKVRASRGVMAGVKATAAAPVISGVH